MSVSLYYEARRTQPITSQEKAACEEIASRYDAQYPYGEMYEGFCIYNWERVLDEWEKDVIFSGATALPYSDDMNYIFRVVNWWLKCLGEITDILHGAQWHVNIDDSDISWSEEEHYLFPIDEEDDF